jgi:mannose-6-phosphate isomerase-like protein (cupin superfamily)
MPTTVRYIVRPEDVPTYSPPLHAGTVNCRLVGRDVNGSQAVEVVLGVVQPGGLAERHTHEVEQAMYILEGRALVEVNGEAQECGPGTACFFPPGVTHRVESLGPGPLRALVIYAPPLERSTAAQPFRPA